MPYEEELFTVWASMTKDIWLLDLRNPTRVERVGHGFGGPLKLHHRNGKRIVIKWPSYTQWSGVGCREANPTTYVLLEIVEEPAMSRSISGETLKLMPGRVRARQLEEIEPGRKRRLVTELVERCDKEARR